MNLDEYAAGLTINPTMTDSVTRLLRQAILRGALPGGTVLRQEEVARKFGVSRVPVREALLKLEGEGLVETQPRRGVVVTALSTEDFEEILEMRLALETVAIERAAQRFTRADTDAALAVVERARAIMRSASESHAAAEFEGRWGELNWEFHQRLYAPAGRPRLLAAIDNLQQLFARHMRMHIEQSDPMVPLQQRSEANTLEWAAVLNEHEQMALACSRNDAATAVALLKRHIAEHGLELVRAVREQQDAAQPAEAPRAAISRR
ncbi:GntR family transcriptional regulator [Ramlibacter alkalitolerans]|uniref:GntR family transcriptional regulator n=1 Tax=Ramlibacter alkalitolerans TaxID=2039631 RepID=A0ABS1JKL3_9BURK|nr:GntR family transcriptional regulator [Ramlibacter alkalitolerans]MBL0424759.1 GntR family transcriptional regulator [Ramlibacter alkalitolerans]